MGPQLSRTARVSLEAAGWHEGRVIDIDAMVGALNEAGMKVLGPAITFLWEFGDLTVVHPTLSKEPGRTCWSRFAPELALRRFPPHWIFEWMSQLERELTVVGELYDGGEMMLLDAEGAVFVGRDSWCAPMAPSPLEAIERLCATERR